MNKSKELTLYVVQNHQGLYFRAKGYGGSGQSWVDDLEKAKIYTKISSARRVVGFWSNPKNFIRGGIVCKPFSTPTIIKLTVSNMEVIDGVEEQKIREERLKMKEIREKERRVQYLKNDLQQQIQEKERLEKEIEKAMEEINQSIKK